MRRAVAPRRVTLNASVLAAKNVKTMARPSRTGLQGGEHATGTAKGCADSDGRRTCATLTVDHQVFTKQFGSR
jgi:hypothetical protein